MKRIVTLVLIGALSGAIMIGISMLILEWIVGCGGTYIDAIGRTRFNECLFMQFPRR
jgi:tetrahydromethanopterin S-methyltransferase subunit D